MTVGVKVIAVCYWANNNWFDDFFFSLSLSLSLHIAFLVLAFVYDFGGFFG